MFNLAYCLYKSAFDLTINEKKSVESMELAFN
jgi:hypothetical protein